MSVMILTSSYIKRQLEQGRPISSPLSILYLRCNTDVMRGAHIPRGAIMAVDRDLKPLNGQVVVAVANGDLVVRHLLKDKNECKLTASDRKVPEIIYSSNVIILGVVVSVVIPQIF